MSPTGDLLRHDAELGHHLPGEAADAHLQAVQVGRLLDLLAEPAAHLAAGVAGEEGDDVVLLVELVHQLAAAADLKPCGLHAAVQPERHGSAEREGRILADIVVGRGVAHLDRAVAAPRPRPAAPERFRRRQIAGSGICCRSLQRPPWTKTSRRAVDRIERLREARRHSPFGFRHRLGDRRCGHGGACHAEAGTLDEVSSLHRTCSPERISPGAPLSWELGPAWTLAHHTWNCALCNAKKARAEWLGL